jgi:hypothetical protein
LPNGGSEYWRVQDLEILWKRRRFSVILFRKSITIIICGYYTNIGFELRPLIGLSVVIAF